MANEKRSLVSNVIAALGGEAIQAIFGVAIFFGVVFQLSQESFGLYVAVTATGLILGTLANLGSQEILVRNVSRGADLSDEWGKTVTTQAIGALIGLGIGMAVRPIFYPDLSWLTAFIFLALNIFVFWAVETTVRVGQATDNLTIGTRGRLFFGIGRLVGVASFLLIGTGDIDDYALVAGPLGLAGGAAAVLQTIKTTSTRPRLSLASMDRLIRGIPFVGTAGAQDLLAGFDRPLLSANGLVVETGNYGIADRIARISSIPTLALVRATASDFFRSGETDDRRTFALATQYARPAIAYGFTASIGVGTAALLLRGFVPDRLEPVLPMLAALSALSTLHATQLFPANVLTGTDRQSTRLVLYISAAGLNIVLNLLWIPIWGWPGAAAATLVAETLLAILLWIVAWRLTMHAS